MNHQEYQELLALHALSALDAEEASVIEQHLQTCAVCRDDLIEWREASGLLAHAATPLEPRANLRAEILSQARAEARANGKTAAEVLPFRQPPQAAQWPAFLKIAAAIAFVALILGVILLYRREEGLQHQIAELKAHLNTNQQELAQARVIEQLLRSPNTRTMTLAGMPDAQSASGNLIYDRQSGQALLMARALPPTPADKAYELWFIADGRPLRGGVFTVDASGHAMMMDQVPAAAREGAVFAITLEPKQGVDLPTGPMYLKSSGT